jgi:hypothetical protein
VTHDERQQDQKRHDQKRPLTEEEKLDEAIAESFIGSDPPANNAPTRVGAPPKRKTKKADDNKA